MSSPEIEQELLKTIVRLHKSRCQEKTSITDDEAFEERLFHILKAIDELSCLVKEIDPDRFGPIKTAVLRHQELDYRRLHVCPICGISRCTSDHK